MRITESTETRVAFAHNTAGEIVYTGLGAAITLLVWVFFWWKNDDPVVLRTCFGLTILVPLNFLWQAFFKRIELRVAFDRALGMVLFEQRFLLRPPRRWARPLAQVKDLRVEGRPSGRGGWRNFSLVLGDTDRPLQLLDESIGRGEVDDFQRCGAELQAFVRRGGS